MTLTPFLAIADRAIPVLLVAMLAVAASSGTAGAQCST